MIKRDEVIDIVVIMITVLAMFLIFVLLLLKGVACGINRQLEDEEQARWIEEYYRKKGMKNEDKLY